MRKNMWSKDDLDLLKFMYQEQGCKVSELMKAFNRSEPSIRKKIRELGINSALMKKERNNLYFCPMCREYKNKSEFGVNKSTKHNIRTYCLKCEKKYLKDLKNQKLDKLYNKPKQIQEKTKEEVNGGATKVCNKCNIKKSVDEFNWSKKYIKLNCYCKECANLKSKEHKLKFAEEKGYIY